jgi:hypothetical protein
VAKQFDATKRNWRPGLTPKAKFKIGQVVQITDRGVFGKIVSRDYTKGQRFGDEAYDDTGWWYDIDVVCPYLERNCPEWGLRRLTKREIGGSE